jgi:hypothetical protein
MVDKMVDKKEHKEGWIAQDTLTGQVYKVLPYERLLELKRNFTTECPDCHNKSLITIPCGYALRLIENKPPFEHLIAIAGDRVCVRCCTKRMAVHDEKKPPLNFKQDEMELLMYV